VRRCNVSGRPGVITSSALAPAPWCPGWTPGVYLHVVFNDDKRNGYYAADEVVTFKILATVS
jgi:hypothetical protein